MLNYAAGFEKVYLATGRTALRRRIDGLASIIKYNFKLDPFRKNVLFLFCGRQSTKIKGLVWEGDGFLLIYKRLNAGAFSWPGNSEEAELMEHLDDTDRLFLDNLLPWSEKLPDICRRSQQQ